MGWWSELVLGPRRLASRLRGAVLGMAMLAATSRGRITARLPAALRTCGVRSVHLKVRSCRACLSPATPHPTPPSGAAQASLADVPDSALAGKRVLVRVDFNVPQVWLLRAKRSGFYRCGSLSSTDGSSRRAATAMLPHGRLKRWGAL